MADNPSDGDPGIRPILQEIRDLRREASEDRKQAAEDRKRFDLYLKEAAEDRKQAAEYNRRMDERMARMQTAMNRSFAAIAGALRNLAEVTERLVTTNRDIQRALRQNTAVLLDIRAILRRSNGQGRNGNGRSRRRGLVAAAAGSSFP